MGRKQRNAAGKNKVFSLRMGLLLEETPRILAKSPLPSLPRDCDLQIQGPLCPPTPPSRQLLMIMLSQGQRKSELDLELHLA